MNKIILNRVAVDRLYELFNKINQSKDFGHVTLESEGDNGIGDVITATFYIEHKDVDGEFKVIIIDQNDW